MENRHIEVSYSLRNQPLLLSPVCQVYLNAMHAQGVYNRLLLVPIVGGACFLRHQLAAVFNASFGVFQMTYENSRIDRMGEEGDFCDVLPTYP